MKLPSLFIYSLIYLQAVDTIAEELIEKSSFKEIKGISNLNQTIFDTATSVTTIKTRDVKALGLNYISEFAMLFPGTTSVGSKHNAPIIQYHGTNAYKNRMGIRLNGNYYDIGQLHQNIWTQIPFNNVKEITLSKSPASAEFGDKSFTSEMNIITYAAHENITFQASHTKGSKGTEMSFVSTGGSITDNLSASLFVSKEISDGLDFSSDKRSERYDYQDYEKYGMVQMN